METDRTIVIVAEHDGKIVSCAEVERKRGNKNHLGEIGISVLNEYREVGIGMELLTLSCPLRSSTLFL
jgi:N-acetylglutamate synthase-like GNAT family acetyltransferase